MMEPAENKQVTFRFDTETSTDCNSNLHSMEEGQQLTSVSLKMADSGFYESSSEHGLQRQSPLARSTAAPLASEGAGLSSLSVSPVPLPDRWTPLSDDASDDQEAKPSQFGGEEVDQLVQVDEAPELPGASESGLVILLRSQCQAQERELASLRSEKISESVTRHMSTLEESLAKTEELQEKIHYLNKDLLKSKENVSQLENKLAQKEPLSPQRGGSRPASAGTSPTGTMYLPGRWTAYRAYSKKHGEEMKLISAALEAEGYGPSQVSADEVVRHLWWEKERMKKALGGNNTEEDDGEQDFEKLPQLFHDYQEKIGALERTIQQLQEEAGLRGRLSEETQDSLKRELRECLTTQEEAESKLSTLQGRMAALEQDNTQLRTSCRAAKTTIHEQNKSMAKSADDVVRLERQCLTLQSELQREKKHATGLKADLQSLRSQVDTFSSQLSDAQRDLAAKDHQLLLHTEMVQEAARGRALHANEIAELKSEVEKLQVENRHLEHESGDFGLQVEELRGKAEDLNQKLASRTAELKQATEEYSAYKREAECRRAELQGQLHDMETSFMTTSSRLKLKESAFEVLTADATGLQTQVNSLREEVTRVSSRLQQVTKELEEKRSALARETSSLQDAKSNLELIQQESLSLKHQLEVQRERSATALNKIQRQYFEESGRLRQEKALLEQEAEQAKATLLHKERSLSAAMATKTELQLEIQRLNEEKNEIKGEMRKETMNVTLLENKVTQLQHAVDSETQAKTKLEQELQILRSSHSKLEVDLATHKEKLHGLSQIRSQLEVGIERERAQVARVRGELGEVEEHARSVERQLQEERREHHSETERLNKQAQEGRHAYQEEKASLKKQLKRLGKEIETMRTQHDQLAATTNQLEADNVRLTDESRLMADAASERETLVRQLEEEARSLHTRNQDLEMEVSQLKVEVETLYQSCLEFEEYKKRLDSNARAEMQRVLADVTRHMEQQYLAQKSLEKLRADNETLALRQKDRKIDRLRDELRRTKLNGRQDQLHLESLELEAQLLRSQKKEMDRSRKKLEKRLEKVNTSLTQSLKSSFTDSMPSYLTSTPRSSALQ